jgi:hypothetical protein
VIFQVETMGMGTVTVIGIESVGENHEMPVGTAGITETSETAGILEITEIMPGMVGTPKTVETILIQGYPGTAGVQERVEKLLEIKSVKKLWSVAVNVSVNVSVRKS